MSGIFITFEGIEGCGKSTQIARLEEDLRARGVSVETTREPGGTDIAESIREILLNPAHTAMVWETESLLYAASRAQHVAQRIRPALDRGDVVLCDRFHDSTAAYQGAGRGFRAEDLEMLHRISTGGLLPDLTILIDIPVELGLARATDGRTADRIEAESIQFHEKVRAGYLKLASREAGRIQVVDGERSVEVVARDIAACVEPLLAGMPAKDGNPKP